MALELATILSGTANGITMIAFPWLVLDVTGNATAAGTISAATAVPLLAAVLFTGTLVDMLGRRRVSVASDLLSMGSVALVPILDATVGFSFGLLLLVAALGAVFDPAGVTARKAMLPEASAAAGLSLERANGLHEAAYGFAFLLGPGIGGVLIALVGVTSTFWATTAAFALSSLVMAAVRIPHGERPPIEDRPRGMWAATRDGFVFLWRDRGLRDICILTSILAALWLPVQGVVLPFHFTEQGSPERLGWLATAMSGGAVAGALLFSAFGTMVRRRPLFIASLLGTSIPIVAIAPLPPFAAMLVFGFAAGFFYGPVNPITNLAIQERTSPAMRGRVVGAVSASAYAAGPAGYLVAGPLVEGLGVRTTLLILGGLLLLASAVGSTLPALRLLDPAEPAPSRSSEPIPVGAPEAT